MSDSKETYLVHCSSCQAPFDAFDTPWCSCLVTERTLVCPSCLTCFCKAPASYKQKFWSEAPKSFWEVKLQEHSAEPTPTPNSPPDNLVRPLVLLVDDEKDIRKIASRVIESLGYGLIVGHNGQEGLDLARAHQPDLILSDALMPKMDGREMCRLLKADPATAAIKIVVMTALYTSKKHEIEAFKTYKVDDYLAKPLDFNRLRAVLQKHIG
jgi:CheY-like chemotaxis protein